MGNEQDSTFIITRFCDYVEAYLKQAEEDYKTPMAVGLPVSAQDFYTTMRYMEGIKEEAAKRGLKVEINDRDDSIDEYGHEFAFKISHLNN